MDEIVSQVSARTGLPPDQAREVVELVIGLLKERLPAPAAKGLDAVVGGSPGQSQAGSAGFLGEAQQALKRMFGGG